MLKNVNVLGISDERSLVLIKHAVILAMICFANKDEDGNANEIETQILNWVNETTTLTTNEKFLVYFFFGKEIGGATATNPLGLDSTTLNFLDHWAKKAEKDLGFKPSLDKVQVLIKYMEDQEKLQEQAKKVTV